MPEYIANLDDVKTAYAYSYEVDRPVQLQDPERVARRERAFDRMIREVQDEYYDEGFAAAQWEFED